MREGKRISTTIQRKGRVSLMRENAIATRGLEGILKRKGGEGFRERGSLFLAAKKAGLSYS